MRATSRRPRSASTFPRHGSGRSMRVESAGDVRAISRAGAMGLMQIMPATWDESARPLSARRDPYDPRDNILAGAAYLARAAMIATDRRGFWPPTMQVQGATRIIARGHVRCRVKRAPMSPRSRLFPVAAITFKACASRRQINAPGPHRRSSSRDQMLFHHHRVSASLR